MPDKPINMAPKRLQPQKAQQVKSMITPTIKGLRPASNFWLMFLMEEKQLKHGSQFNATTIRIRIRAIIQFRKDILPKRNNEKKQIRVARYPSHFPQIPSLPVLSYALTY